MSGHVHYTREGAVPCTDPACEVNTRAKTGRCRYCGKRLSLTKDGKIWRHKMRTVRAWCGGSGQMPA